MTPTRYLAMRSIRRSRAAGRQPCRVAFSQQICGSCRALTYLAQGRTGLAVPPAHQGCFMNCQPIPFHAAARTAAC